jgi:hypothetical protein
MVLMETNDGFEKIRPMKVYPLRSPPGSTAPRMVVITNLPHYVTRGGSPFL